MPQEILGGTKTKSRTTSKKEAPFRMRNLIEALEGITRTTRMDTGETRTRQAPTQPLRARSQRSQTLAAKAAAKALEIAAANGTKKAATRLKKPPNVRRLPVVKEEQPVRRKAAPPKHPALIAIDENTIVKRNLSDVITYENKEDYVNKFTQLFKDVIPHLREAIGDHSINKMEDATSEKIGLTIVQLTDDLYFTIRDKLINEVRPTSNFQ
jgi:hypothetical protein